MVGCFIKFLLILLGILSIPMTCLALGGVGLNVKDSSVVIDNGLCALTLSKPEGIVTQIQYQGTRNLLEGGRNNGGGYYDIVWNEFGNASSGNFDVIKGEEFKIINQTDELVEVSFSKIWNFSMAGVSAPLNIDKRFVMLNNYSGFYSYAIFEHPKEYPDFVLGEARMAFKLNKTMFHYMAVADDMQREMPSAIDRSKPNAVPLAYPEAVVLKDPVEKEFQGEVDDKYQYSRDNKDIKVHGWIGKGEPAAVGFWQITPSNEFRSGGPLKQSLTSHVGPTTLSTFLSSHYVGNELSPRFEAGESWKKVYGPVFIYLNSAAATKEQGAYSDLWQDAKNQMLTEVQKWPYDFPASEDFLRSDQRGKVSGRLFVSDGDKKVPASDAYIGLAAPGESGSWQLEFKGYQFWTTTNDTGYFSIDRVRPGDYNLYAWVPGFIGDYRYDAGIPIKAGSDILTGEIVYQPPRSGPTLWEIGYPDRLAAEFNVPDPNPKYVNKLYVNHADKFRQYGLWERYSELYPDKDLLYTIGESKPATDWFFAHVPRKTTTGNRLSGTTWQIRFRLDRVDYRARYKLWVALASANYGELHVRVNNPYTVAMFRSGMIGRDNAIARHGIHGLHSLFNVTIPGFRLWRGENIIYLTQPRSSNLFQGFLYDYIRLEGPYFDYY